MKGAEDFINGNWRGSNGHETGQWSAQGGWSTLASCRPHFLFLVLVDGQLRTPPQLLRLSDNFRNPDRFYASSPWLFLPLDNRSPIRYIRALGPLATGTRGEEEREGGEGKFKEDFFLRVKTGPLIGPHVRSRERWKRFRK